MPVGARVLYVDPETSSAALVVTFWAQVETSITETEERSFNIVGTGHPIPTGATYRGTTQMRDLGLVFHLYEMQSPS